MRLICTGDIALGDHPKTVGFGFFSRYKAGLPVEKAGEIFPNGFDADIRFGNLEFALDGTESNEVCCRGVPEFAQFLKTAGFNVLNVANNHIYQYGIHAFEKTINTLNHLNIRTCGTLEDFKGGNSIIVGGMKISFLGWSDRPRQYSTEVPPYNEFNTSECYEHVRNAAAHSDVVCVSLHWGDEFIQVPRNEERVIARNCIDNGATLVIGHHSHVLREIEEYRGGLIAYSLGNFIGDMLWDKKTRQAACLYVEVEPRKIKTWRLIPASIGEDYFPKYLAEGEARVFAAEFGAVQEMLKRLLGKYTYDKLAKRALRRHQLLTVLHFLKNLNNYPPGFASATLVDALRGRLRRLGERQ